MKISEIITDKFKLRIPPIVYYDLLADVVEAEEQQETKKGHWIPISERLPEDFQRVLITVVNYSGNKVVRVAEYDNYKGVFRVKENHEEWEIGEKGLLAWMPLPEPCNEESEEV